MKKIEKKIKEKSESKNDPFWHSLFAYYLYNTKTRFYGERKRTFLLIFLARNDNSIIIKRLHAKKKIRVGK